MKSLPEYIACFGEGYNLDLTRKTQDELSTTVFVAPETRRETLYQVKRPRLEHKGPRNMPGSDWEYTGDVLEEYWCGVKIRQSSLLFGEAKDKEVFGAEVFGKMEYMPSFESTVPLPIPEEIKNGIWKFETTTLDRFKHYMWEWRQKGEWGKYAEKVLDLKTASGAKAHAEMHMSKTTGLIMLLNNLAQAYRKW